MASTSRVTDSSPTPPYADIFHRQVDNDGTSSSLGEEHSDAEEGLRSSIDSNEGDYSAFTNPSWYGSPFTRRNSSFAWANTPESPKNGGEHAETCELEPSLHSARLPAHEICRNLLLDMNKDFERICLSADTLDDEQSGKAPVKECATLDGCPSYLCATCGTALALQDEVVSKAFSGSYGKAFLFFSTVNTHQGPKENRHLMTGMHTVRDLCCNVCDRNVGWVYLKAYESSQRYKEGEFKSDISYLFLMQLCYRQIHSRACLFAQVKCLGVSLIILYLSLLL